MRTFTTMMVRFVAVAVFSAFLTGCAALDRHPGAGATDACSPGAAAKADSGRDSDQASEEEKYAEEDAKDARQHAKLDRDLAIAHEHLAQARLTQAHAEIENGVAVAKAERELAMETERLHVFTGRTAPNRIQQAQLDLVQAEDRATEAREEFEQLEKMYAEDDFADGTKEIVLERGRRRLERSQEDLRLRRESFNILTEKTIPLEVADHEWKVEQKQQAVETAHRSAESSAIDKHIAGMKAEAEVASLEAEIATLEEKIAKRRKEHEKN